MSNHCPKCGTCHEEDDGRVCAACTTWDALAEKRARQDAEIESLRKSNQMFVQAIESWKKLHRAAVGALAKKMEENAALAERLAGACVLPELGRVEQVRISSDFEDGSFVVEYMRWNPDEADWCRLACVAGPTPAAALHALRTKLEARDEKRG